jgi:asparagine synthase (glutamine-hydrolysing)
MDSVAGYLVVSGETRALDPVLEQVLEGLVRGRLDHFGSTYPGLRVLTAPNFRWPVAQVHRRHVLIGEWRGLGAHPSSMAGQNLAGPAFGARLMSEGWGAYLMVWRDDAGGLNVIRDPSGRH